MKRLWFVALLVALLSTTVAAQQSTAFLSPFRNARFVYVTSYDGSPFSPNLFPEDRRAISNVEEALQKSGHFTVVYSPQDADIIIAVESRPSEDVLAVYDRQSWGTGAYLWRAMGKGGLSAPAVPLVHKFEAALMKANGRTAA